MPLRLSALGLSVLQVQQGLDTYRTLSSFVHIYLRGQRLSVSRYEALPIRVIDSGGSVFVLSNCYMQVWFSGLTGLLKSIQRMDKDQEQRIERQERIQRQEWCLSLPA